MKLKSILLLVVFMGAILGASQINAITKATVMTWVKTTVYSSGEQGEYNSIAIDSAGKIHISYHGGSQNKLHYSTNSSGSWVIETVDSSGYKGKDNSIAVDSSDNIHISYFDGSNDDLKYITNKSVFRL